jgi:hypothetical protein
MECPSCGSEIDPSATSCPDCGAALSATAGHESHAAERARTAAPPRQRIAGGAGIGTVAAVLVVLFMVGMGGFFVYRSYVGAPSQPITPPKLTLPKMLTSSTPKPAPPSSSASVNSRVPTSSPVSATTVSTGAP